MASSATAGFFQTAPVLCNQFEDDHIFRDVFLAYTSGQDKKPLVDELSSFGQRILEPDVFSLIADAERNPPSLSTHSTFGVPRTTLHTSYGWRELQDMGIRAGMVAIPYSTDAKHFPSRMHQFLKYHLWCGSSAVTTCPGAMTDGAATLLRRHLGDPALESQQRAVFKEAYQRLTSFDPSEAWTSGQWMTERSGGSDVRGTETVATFKRASTATDAHGMPLGPWSVDGFKWFSSATDSQMAVLLAKTSKGGLSAFYAPMRRATANGGTEMNGISIQRLKPKLGTRALPTAELVLKDMRAWLIGKEGDGVREISAILNITRLHNAIAAMGHWARALSISRAYTRVRKVEGGLLQDNAMHIRGLARNTVSYGAHMQLGFFVVQLLDDVERPEKVGGAKAQQSATLLRLLTPVAKAQCSKMAIYGIQECMESLGGVGYIEDEQDFNIARLFRDTCVLSIWEGTTDVMATDVVRVLKGRTGLAALQMYQDWVRDHRQKWTDDQLDAKKKVAEVQDELSRYAAMDAAQMKVVGRELLELLAWLTACVLLVDAASTGQGSAAAAVAEQWLTRKSPDKSRASDTDFQMNRLLAFGPPNRTSATTSKL